MAAQKTIDITMVLVRPKNSNDIYKVIKKIVKTHILL